MQTRIVTCLDQWDKPSEECDPKTRMTSMQDCSTGIQCSSVEETTTISSTTSSSVMQITKRLNQHLVTDDPDEDLEEDVGSEEDFEESLHHIRHSTTQQDNSKQTTPEEMPPTPGEPSENRMQRDDSRAFSNYYANHHEPNNYGHQIYYPHQALPKPEKLVDQRVPSEAT